MVESEPLGDRKPKDVVRWFRERDMIFEKEESQKSKKMRKG